MAAGASKAVGPHLPIRSVIVDDPFDRWMRALEERHLAALTFPELSRALRALSSTYVERRGQIGHGAALSGAGKRAAFALFYGPLHYLLVREIVRALPEATDASPTLVDLGCGTGAAGAAWAASCGTPPRVIGVDRHPWAIGEAARTYRAFGLRSDVRRGDVADVRLPKSPVSLLAAFTMNELPAEAREALLQRLMDRSARGDRVLIVEPIARLAAPWWGAWESSFVAAGGRADDWRVSVNLPSIVEKLDRASGLNHRELTGRSLWLPANGSR
jgi:SAM-dependent methyltransferase